jgi:1,4-dihydroxy-2-naphthoate octaprenyltransferase
MIVAGIFFGFTKVYSLISLVAAPFAAKAIRLLRKDPESVEKLVPAMGSAVTYSRITGFLLALSLVL